jgi:toxin ParE1/3/4
MGTDREDGTGTIGGRSARAPARRASFGVKLRVHMSPAAEQDVADHFVYIGLDSPESAERFLRRADETFEFLANSPRIGKLWGSTHSNLKGVRVWRVIGFSSVLVFYRPGRQVVDVRRLIHGARDLQRELDR